MNAPPATALLERPGNALDAFFNPASVAVIGASADPSRAGGRVLATLAAMGYGGAIHCINPSRTPIGDRPSHGSLAEAPGLVDLALICVSAERVPAAIRQCGEHGVRAAIVFADGFSTPPASEQLEEAIAEARARSGLRLMGPNTVGSRNVNGKVFATIATDGALPQRAGDVAVIGQSGGLALYFGSAKLGLRGIGAKYIIDTGAEADVDAAECLEWVADDPDVSCAVLILEGCRDGRRLKRAVSHMTALGKPVVFWKTGRTAASATQIASHTGSLAGNARVFEAALRASGAIVVHDEIELLDAVAIVSARRIPRGRRLGVVSPSGGYAIVTLDAAERFDLLVPEADTPPSPNQMAVLGMANFANPLDVYALFGQGQRSFDAALQWMDAQPIDAVAVWLSYACMTQSVRDIVTHSLADFARKSGTPVFCCGLTTPEHEAELRALGVVWFEEPTRLAQAIGLVAPRAPETAGRPATAPGQNEALAGAQARDILSDLAGLPQIPSYAVESIEAAKAAQQELAAPVFLKLEVPGMAHKTEIGGVLGPLGADAVSDGFTRLATARKELGEPEAKIVLQPMAEGVELALGGFVDDVFGPTVMVAVGGIFLEILDDVAFSPAPVTRDQARSMILGLRGAPLLKGARGREPADIDAAAAALAELSEFVVAHASQYAEIDINPLIVRGRGRGVVAVDALIVPTRRHESE